VRWSDPYPHFLFFWAIPVAGSLLAWRAVALFRGAGVPDPRRTLGFAAALLGTRAAFGLVLYLLLDYRSEGHLWHWVRVHALPILEGQVPGRDFLNGYGPLLPYAQALSVLLLGSPLSVFLPFILGDVLAVILSWRVARRVGTEGDGAAAVLWTLWSPLLWVQVWVGSQDEPLFAGAVVVALWFVAAGRPLATGIALGLGLALTKSTFALYGLAVAMALWPDRRALARTCLGGLATTAAVYGAYLAAGARLNDYPFQEHFRIFRTYGVSLPDGLQAFLDLPEALLLACAVAGTAGPLLAAGFAVRRWREAPPAARACAAVAAAHCVFMALMPGALNHYFVQGAVAVTLLLVPRRDEPTARSLLAANTILACLLSLSWNGAPTLLGFREPGFEILLLGRAFKIGCILFHVSLLAWILGRRFPSHPRTA